MLVDPAQLRRLAVPFMNADHGEEARLVNSAADLVEGFRAGRVAAEEVSAALAALYLHLRAHFTAEESAMLDASFPAYTFHRAEHVRMLGELGAAERGFREERDADALADFLATVPGWFERHIATMDAATARYVAEWGA